MKRYVNEGAIRPVGYPGKRAFDLVVSAALVIMLSPLLLIIGAWVRIAMGSPVLFRQTRTGWQGQLFEIIKFRTMRGTRDGDGRLLPDAERLTPSGRFLRKYSLDELPELVNVIRGEMSLVGPRPLFERYLPYYRPSELARFDVRPGITGLAQVSGRNLIPWDDRLSRDVEYVENLSLRRDLRILLSTVHLAASAHGVSVDPDLVESDLSHERGADQA